MFRLDRMSYILLAAAGLASLASCGSKPNAKASTPDSSNGEVLAPESTPTKTAAFDSLVKNRMLVFNPSDTQNIKLNPGRGKQDSMQYASAIKAGARAMAKWPFGPTPLEGAILPANRVVAYYGNPHSKKMGVIGEYPEQQMLGMLDKTVAEWRAADKNVPVIPAIHLVTVVAQGNAGPDGMWRRRESPDMIERAYGWAKSRKGLLILDIQGGHSTLQTELPLLMKYMERPDVHLGIDPEFYMHYKREGLRPSSKVGQMMASDVNYVIQTLDKLVAEKHLPPKILVVHRFRSDMVPDAESIKPTPRVQVVMDMDGWGPAWLKFDSYRDYIVSHPVQFTGFKLFYHNDTKKNGSLLTPGEVLRLLPRPLYIQYQ